jgi:hypothetical protein
MRWANFPKDCVWPKLKEGVLCERIFFPNHIITYPLMHNEFVKRMKLNMIYHVIKLLFFQHTIYIEHIFQLDNWQVVEQNIHLKFQNFHNDSIINMV